MKKRIAVIGLACETEVGFEAAPELLKCTTTAIKENCKNYEVLDTGIVLTNSNSAKLAAKILEHFQVGVLVVCIATWSEDQFLLELLQQMRCSVVLHAFPAVDTGSFCAAQQIASVLTDIHYDRYAGFCEEAGSEREVSEITRILETIECNIDTDFCMWDNLRVGTIGGRVQGMTEIAYDEFALLEKCNAVVIPILETELLSTVESICTEEKDCVIKKIKSSKSRILSSEAALMESAGYYLALKRIVEKYQLQALAISCYTRYMGKVCLAYALLAEDGIACSCEGDVNNAVMMYLLAKLSGQCVNHTDFLYANDEDNTILFSHCGSSGMSIAAEPTEIELTPVRLMEEGVCCRFIPKSGKVTLADLTGHGDELRMSVMTGDLIACEMEFPGNPAKVRFESSVREICCQTIAKGCGHHWMIAYGDVSGELYAYCKERGIRFLNLTDKEEP